MHPPIYVRYGNNYAIIAAIVLPPLLIAPFIFVMQQYKPTSQWLLWLVIFGFLGFIIALVFWLIKSLYPVVIFTVHDDGFSIYFNRTNLFYSKGFYVKYGHITSLSLKELRGGEYYLFTTTYPNRKFQISARSYNADDQIMYNKLMLTLLKKVENGF